MMNTKDKIPSVRRLRKEYKKGKTTPKEVIRRVFNRIATDDTNAWIAKRPQDEVLDDAGALGSSSIDDKPLYGIPFGIKDNIDFGGLPTSAGCPAYAFQPEKSATVVQKLIDAGGLLIGKTNMDQFATGLVGTRSPYGMCRNVFNTEFISGGSSSGSGVAVANQHVSFALGTDTAGSGRIPAALNGIVGLKPTRGVLSNSGVVPGCESLSCISILAHTVDDVRYIGRIAAGYDKNDSYSRPSSDLLSGKSIDTVEAPIGIPESDGLKFYNNNEAKSLYNETVSEIRDTFDAIHKIDFSIFKEASNLLYNGPWVAERLTNVGEFIKNHPDDIDPTVRGIIRDGEMYSASDAFSAFHRLEELRRQANEIFKKIDALVVPTIGTIYTVQDEQLHPLEINSELGYYTNFVNLLDLAAVSVPTGHFESGPAFSVSVIGNTFKDFQLTKISKSILNEDETAKVRL